jgi:hypothetical protein
MRPSRLLRAINSSYTTSGGLIVVRRGLRSQGGVQSPYFLRSGSSAMALDYDNQEVAGKPQGGPCTASIQPRLAQNDISMRFMHGSREAVSGIDGP